MAAKSVVLEGYGAIMISSINVNEKDLESVDPSGSPVVTEYRGTSAKRVYVNGDGVEVPSSQVCKKVTIEDEDLILPKFKQTKEVDADSIAVLEDNSLIYRALDRKFYSVVTDNDKIRDLVINQNKSLQFPFTAGNGWKIWNAVLTNWRGKMIMVGCRGDLAKELEKFADDTVEFELEIIPQQKNMKKLVKAMAMI